MGRLSDDSGLFGEFPHRTGSSVVLSRAESDGSALCARVDLDSEHGFMGKRCKVTESMAKLSPGSDHRREHTDPEALLFLW